MEVLSGIQLDTAATLHRPVFGRASHTVAHMEDL